MSTLPRFHPSKPIPASAGIGAKPQHHADLMNPSQSVNWVEVHAENFMGGGGPALRRLEDLAQTWPLSVHGVGLSLGGAGPLDPEHLKRLRDLVERFEPALVSEHLAWSSSGGAFFNDLLPVPYTRQSLDTFCAHVDETQSYLKRRILIENPSAYLAPAGAEMSELEFLTETARRTGCSLLLDVNNIYVSATNLGFSADDYSAQVPSELIEEIHLAGFTRDQNAFGTLLIDTHGARVSADVWALYETLIARIGPRPTLIEWDTDVPAFHVLEDEAARCNKILDAHTPRESLHAAS